MTLPWSDFRAKRKNQRRDRLTHAMREALSVILHQDASDQRFKGLTITRVLVSPDYAIAKVYVTFLGDDDPKEVKEVLLALSSAAAYARTRLAERLLMRTTPALRFYHDAELREMINIRRVLDDLK